jgi:hypothetical protein
VAPIFENLKTARREVERVSRAHRRSRDQRVRYSDGTAESGLDNERTGEGAIISSIAPSFTDPDFTTG